MSKKTPENTKILIAGAGLGGALMACYLGKAGYQVELHEKRPDPRTVETDSGRSINLALSTRGIHTLERAGVAEKILKTAVPMPGRMLHALDGSTLFQPYGQKGQQINSVSRSGLNIALLNAAEKRENVSMVFDSRCVSADLDKPAATFADGQTGEKKQIASDVLLGADGAFSAVRSRMQRLNRFDYSQTYLPHGYKELSIPAGKSGAFQMEKNALHIWPRGDYMMIALPNEDGSFTVTLFWPFEGEKSFAALKTKDQIERFFEKNFPDALPLMPTLAEDYLANPVGSLVTVRCFPWQHAGKVALLGDAAHAVVPFYGQGMNASFEDCAVLDECVREHAPNWEKTLEEYQSLRKENCDALADLAIEHYEEMRDKAASLSFRAKKRLGLILQRLMPEAFMPIYSMVTFSRIPYAEAVRRAEKQEIAIKRILLGAGAAVLAGMAAALWLAI